MTATVFLVLLSFTVPANGAGAATAEVQEDPATRVLTDAEALQSLLNDYWTQELTGLYGLSFDTPDGFGWYQDSSNPSCGGTYEDGTQNAYYCSVDGDEYIAYDLNWLISYLDQSPGTRPRSSSWRTSGGTPSRTRGRSSSPAWTCGRRVTPEN